MVPEPQNQAAHLVTGDLSEDRSDIHPAVAICAAFRFLITQIH